MKISPIDKKILELCKDTELSVLEIADKIGVAQRSGSTRRRIKKLLQTGLLEYTIPEKPNSRLQKYRLVKK